jgi:hypothetical protein
MVKTKIFMGSDMHKADERFNEWIKEMSDAYKEIHIKEFRYQQARYSDHSICILYEEVEKGRL